MIRRSSIRGAEVRRASILGGRPARAPLLRAEWRDDSVPGEGTDWDYFLVFGVPAGRAWHVRMSWPLALLVHGFKDRLSAQRGPRVGEVSVNLGRPGPLLRRFVRVEILPAAGQGHASGTVGSRTPR